MEILRIPMGRHRRSGAKVKPNFITYLEFICGYNTRIVIWAEQGLGDMLLFSSLSQINR